MRSRASRAGSAAASRSGRVTRHQARAPCCTYNCSGSIRPPGMRPRHRASGVSPSRKGSAPRAAGAGASGLSSSSTAQSGVASSCAGSSQRAAPSPTQASPPGAMKAATGSAARASSLSGGRGVTSMAAECSCSAQSVSSAAFMAGGPARRGGRAGASDSEGGRVPGVAGGKPGQTVPRDFGVPSLCRGGRDQQPQHRLRRVQRALHREQVRTLDP